MKKTFYIGGITFLLVALAGIFIFIKLYNKSHDDLYKATPDFVLSAEQIVSSFEEDENQANKVYLDKIIQIEGIISEISAVNGNSIITITSENHSKSIVCNMDVMENKKVLALQEGQKIVLRGVCAGFLMDVILVRTIIVN